MDPAEAEEYQQNAIDGAAEDITDRRDHITGPWGSGLLDGDKLGEHGNDRLEAYLEGYADALDFAEEQVKGIDNIARYVEDDHGEPEDGESDE